MRIALTGSSGLIGQALFTHLRDGGHDVVRMVRRTPGPGEAHWDPYERSIDIDAVRGCEAVVNLSGAGIGNRRWSEKRKEMLLGSRIASTSFLCETIASLAPSPRVVVNASAIGFYGNRGDEVLTEDSSRGNGFLSDLCEAWEAATAPARSKGLRVVRLRSGVVLAKNGGALGRQLPLFRLGLGGPLGRGDQWLSWITLRDEVSAILRSIEDESMNGPVNACSPNPVPNADFTRALGRALGRPAVLPVPGAALRLALGTEMANEVVLASQRIVPARLEAAGFSFEQPAIEGALSAVLSA